MKKVIRPVDTYWEIFNTENDSIDNGIEELSRNGLQIINSEELAGARLSSDESDDINRESVFVAEGYIYMPNGDVLIASREHNPILKDIRKATEDENRGLYFLDDRVVEELRERAEKDPEKAMESGVLLVPEGDMKNEFELKSFGEYPTIYFLFRNYVHEYGKLLQGLRFHDRSKKGLRIKGVIHHFVPIDGVKKNDKPFARALKINQLSPPYYERSSYIDARYNNLVPRCKAFAARIMTI